MTQVLAATVPDAITFVIAAAICILGALGVVLARNPVHSALMLVMTLFGVAVLFVEEDAQFLAAVQVIVYAGAIVVLFLFVIMLLGVDQKEAIQRDPLPAQRPVAIVIGILGLAEVLLLARGRWPSGARSVSGVIGSPASNVSVIGRVHLHDVPVGFRGDLRPARGGRRRRRRARPPAPSGSRRERFVGPGRRWP